MFKLPAIGQKVKGQNLSGKGFAPKIKANSLMPVFSSIPSDDTAVPFVRKDVFTEYAKRMDERCCKHEDFIKEFREEQKLERERTDRLVKSTLVFVVITLVIMLGAIGWGVFR
jgi:hypothetical protein